MPCTATWDASTDAVTAMPDSWDGGRQNGLPWGEKEEPARYSLYERYFKEDTKKAIPPRRYQWFFL